MGRNAIHNTRTNKQRNVYMQGNVVGFYLHHIEGLGRLTNEEVYRTLRRRRDSVCREEKEQLGTEVLLSNIKLVAYLVRKLCGNMQERLNTYRDTYDTVFDQGIFGMWKAIHTFDVDNERQVQFATYASRCITNEIFMWMRKNKRSLMVVSMEATTAIDAEGGTQTLADILQDESDLIGEVLDSHEYFAILEELEMKLTSREYTLLMMYLEDEMTQAEVSELMNISQSYVSRLFSKTLKKSKKIFMESEYRFNNSGRMKLK